MRAILALALTLALPPDKAIQIASGVAGEDLADTPMTDVINMEASSPTNQLSLLVAVTPGTTTVVDVRCYESVNGVVFAPVPLCDSASPSACVPDVRRFTLANFVAASGVYYLASRWPILKKYAKCSADDPNDGTGTVVITGERSWQ